LASYGYKQIESFEGSKQLTDTAQEALANQGIVKAYRAEQREADRFTAVAKRIVKANLRSASIAGASPPTIEIIGIVFVVLLLSFGQREIIAGHMNTAQFVTFLFFLFRSYDPMRKLSRLQNSMEQALAAAHHVWEVMDEHAAISEKPEDSEAPASHERMDGPPTAEEMAELGTHHLIHATESMPGRAMVSFGQGCEGEPLTRAVQIAKAIRLMRAETKRGSVSLLQRRLTIGYSRASRLIEAMAAAGIVGDYKGSQAREASITLEEWEAMKAAQEQDATDGMTV
jgi:ABC-type multidrug transport system fused ATPase/permease subunit